MISIIIPVYNQAEYLADAIESALDQTKPCEIIVINDGSTDFSLKVADSYKGQGVKVINQANKGLPSARNAGIMSATGEYVLPLDADDLLVENCIEKMELAIGQYSADVIAPSFKTFGVTNGEAILTRIPTLQEFLSGNRLGYFCAIKKSVLQEVGGYNPKMKWGWEDYDLWIDIFKRQHSLCILQDVLVLYRTKEHSMIHDANAHAGELHDQMKRNHPEIYGA